MALNCASDCLLAQVNVSALYRTYVIMNSVALGVKPAPYLHASSVRPHLIRSPTAPFVQTHSHSSLPRRRCINTLATSDAATVTDDQRATLLVTEVLEAIKDSDFGDRVSAEQRVAIDDKLCTLEAIGKQQGPPLNNPLIFGNYEVSYTSTQDNSPRMHLCGSICIDTPTHSGGWALSHRVGQAPLPDQRAVPSRAASRRSRQQA